MATICDSRVLAKKLREIGAGGFQSWLTDSGDLAVGKYPEVHATFDFGRERFVLEGSSTNGSPQTKELVDLRSKAGRRTRDLFIATREKEVRVASAKQAWEEGLKMMEEIMPGALRILCKLSEERARTKRMVAETVEELYEIESLRHHNCDLGDGFYAATNNAEGEIQRFFEAGKARLKIDDSSFTITTSTGEKWA